VGDDAILSVLARADTALELPRLGGMARPDGIAIVSDEHWAFARVDGGTQVFRTPRAPTYLGRVPVLRGLVKLGVSLSPMLKGRGGTSSRDTAVIAVALVAPTCAVFLPRTLSLILSIAVGVATVAWILRGRTLFLHGAEHRAIAAAEERSLVAAWHGHARPTRFSPRCGTNFAALLIPVTLGLEHLWFFPAVALAPLMIVPLSLGLTMELWRVVQSRGGAVTRLLLVPGLALQRLTTREPTLAETRVALRALAAVLEA
jgi:uncharacterized protein YqhQ